MWWRELESQKGLSLKLELSNHNYNISRHELLSQHDLIDILNHDCLNTDLGKFKRYNVRAADRQHQTL